MMRLAREGVQGGEELNYLYSGLTSDRKSRYDHSNEIRNRFSKESNVGSFNDPEL